MRIFSSPFSCSGFALRARDVERLARLQTGWDDLVPAQQIVFRDIETPRDSEERVAGANRVARVFGAGKRSHGPDRQARGGLDVGAENTQASESRIRDTNMANQMVDYVRDQILNQAGTAMLAQANQRATTVLSLLQ